MLGNPGITRPVNNWYCAAEWTTMSPWQERITAMSSMHSAVWGSRSETSMPLLPYRLKVRLVPRSLASEVTNWYLASPKLAGRFWPLSLLSSGLGSYVSMWLGPPDMNRKMTALALALSGMCGGFAASGFMLAVVAAARR